MALKKIYAGYGPLLVIEERTGSTYSLDGSYLARVGEGLVAKPGTSRGVPFTDEEKWEGDPTKVIPLMEIPPLKQRGRFVFEAPEDHPDLKMSAAELAALIEVARKHTRPSKRTRNAKLAG